MFFPPTSLKESERKESEHIKKYRLTRIRSSLKTTKNIWNGRDLVSFLRIFFILLVSAWSSTL